MFELHVGVGQISLRLRHARGLKDKRQVMQSLIQRLRNLGCSVTEAGEPDNLKIGRIGLSFTGSSVSQVTECFSEVERLLLAGYEVLEFYRDIADYSPGVAPFVAEGVLDERDPDD